MNTPLFYPRQIPIEDGSDVTWCIENHAEVEEATRKAKENGDGGGEAPVRLNYLVYNGYPFEVHKGANSVELYIEGARQDIDVGWNQELMSPRLKFNIEGVERKNYPDNEKIEVTISVKNKHTEKVRFASTIFWDPHTGYHRRLCSRRR